MIYASRAPDLFVHAASFSGALDLSHPAMIAYHGTGLPTNGQQPEVFGPALGPWATQEVRHRGHNPVDLAENLRGLVLSVRAGDGTPGNGHPHVPPQQGSGWPDLVVDPVEVATFDMSRRMHERLDALGIEHLWDYYGGGGHTWPFFTRDLRVELPRIMQTFADPPPPPRRFAFNAIEREYRVYRWRVRLERPVLEFSSLEVRGRHGFALAGSGAAAVATAPLYRPRRQYVVLVDDASAKKRMQIRADRDGRLRMTLDLGPADEHQQYTAQDRAAGHAASTASVRVVEP